MRGELLALEKLGIVEATEERHPVHFHVAVLQRGSFAPARAVATATAAPTLPAQPARISAAPATATVDSAAGAVELPAKPVARPETKPAAKATTYVVQKGDNLSTIANRFGLTVARLKSLNGLKTATLQPGQKLKTG